MPRAAVALATSDSRSAGVRARPTGFRLRRVHAVLVGMAIVGVWLVFVFARALGDVDRATEKQQAINAEAATLQQRLDADHRELVLVQTDAFQQLQARAYGLGSPGEVAFALPLDAPSAPPIVPLGAVAAQPTTPEVATPLDSWLKILFGN